MPVHSSNFIQPLRSASARYACAIGLFGLAFGIRWVADHMFPPGFPFLTFFPAVIAATFLGGRGPGFLCGLLSGLAAWYFFIPPVGTFAINGQVAVALLFYTFVVVVDVLLIDGLTQRQRKLVESQARLQQMAEHQTLLFKELQHRVANNLASIASMLRLQRRRIERDPLSALDVIDRADERIELMGRVHRQLYDPASLELPVAEQIARAVEQARLVGAATHVPVSVDVADVRLEISRLMTLVLLITELLTNSFKHAFADQSAPAVHVSLERRDGGMLRLIVTDNGKGSDPAQSDAAPSRGLGTTIIRGFVAQLGGTMDVDGKNGMTTVVDFPEA